MTRIHILVEGDTEERFVKDLIVFPLAHKQVYVSTSKVTTGSSRHRVYKGGIPTYEKVKGEIIELLKEDKEKFVTTMFDVYRLPTSFPDYEQAFNQPNGYATASKLEEGMKHDIQHQRFIPYVQLHEFEALLFSDPEKIEEEMIFTSVKGSPMVEIESQFNSPEEINNGPNTAPSRRILNVYDEYEKVTDGVQIANQIGLDKMRNKCRRFNEWIQKLEQLS